MKTRYIEIQISKESDPDAPGWQVHSFAWSYKDYNNSTRDRVVLCCMNLGRFSYRIQAEVQAEMSEKRLRTLMDTIDPSVEVALNREIADEPDEKERFREWM